MNLKSKTVCIVFHGLFMELAVKLAQSFGKVYYWTPGAQTTFPTMNAGMVGYGLDNIERVDDPFGPHFDEVDLWVYPDIGFGTQQTYLESIGKRVWGSRMGEELEIYRDLCKGVMAEAGCALQPWKPIKGIDALRAHLKAHDEQHVKLNKWRGCMETFFAENYNLVETKLNSLAHDLGAFSSIADFVVEDDLPDRVEIGVDCYCVDGKFPGSTLVGIEVKDLGYISQFMAYDKIPKELTDFYTKISPTLALYGYRNFCSDEIRIGKDKIPYMIDFCARAPSPGNELYQEFYTNLAEIIWAGAGGEIIDPKPAGKFGVEVILKSEWAANNWQPIEFPKENSSFIKLFNSTKIDGKTYIIPQDEDMCEIGAVIGYGGTLEEAADMAKEMGESVKGYGIKFGMGPIDTAKEEMQKINALGIDVFDLEISSTTQ